MRTPMRLLPAAVLAASAICNPLGAQTAVSDEAARAIGAVMNYRRYFLDDPLAFDACKVREALGGNANTLAVQLRGMLDDVAASCPRATTRPRNVVLIDSVRLADSVARVYATVIRGELIHREIYSLDPRTSAPMMSVREVRLWGAVQAYPRRP